GPTPEGPSCPGMERSAPRAQARPRWSRPTLCAARRPAPRRPSRAWPSDYRARSERKATPGTVKAPGVPAVRGSLAREVERDEERVDDERLDEHQAQDHRDEDLARGIRVARDAFERRRRRAALTERAAERRDTDREARAQPRPHARVENVGL